MLKFLFKKSVIFSRSFYLNLVIKVKCILNEHLPPQQTFQRRFNVVFRLMWRRGVARRQINVADVSVGVYNLEQRWIDVAYFNDDLNNVRQLRNNVVIFNVDFQNVGQR